MKRPFLIIDARFYTDLADELVKGASAELERRGAAFERISVPGVLELPSALAMVLRSKGADHYRGFVLLGCVIRGETTHYDIVAKESARAIMALATEQSLATGYGILTVENGAQAWARARVSEKNKGAAAASAAFEMAELQEKLGAGGG
jgi:6,7-dimethyl-8-ribityllumazine synthase